MEVDLYRLTRSIYNLKVLDTDDDEEETNNIFGEISICKDTILGQGGRVARYAWLRGWNQKL